MKTGLQGCGTTTIRYLLFAFNLIFVVFGLVILVVSSIALGSTVHTGNEISVGLGFLIFVGACVFLIAFFGCCGAIRESRRLLYLFVISLGAILIIEIILCSVAYAKSDPKFIDNSLKTLFSDAESDWHAGMKDGDSIAAANEIQKTFECCGHTSKTEWLYMDNVTMLPDSCCTTSTHCTTTDAYDKPCSTVFEEAIQYFGKVLLAMGIVIALIEIIGIWFGISLIHEM